MRPCIRILLAALALAAHGWSANAAAQERSNEFSVGGLLFGDLYHVPSHHLAEGDGAAGIVLRRAYLTFGAKFGDGWSARLRLETNQDGDFETYTFDTGVKDLYLAGTLGQHRLVAGLTSTPTFDVIEKIWGRRYLARTPLDMQGVPSRDTGLFAAGPLNASGSFTYRAMWGAPVEFGKDGNDNERWMAAVGWQPAPGWTIDLYLDREDRDRSDDRRTWQLFVARQADRLTWGAQYANQDRGGDPPLELASGFLVAKTGARSNLVLRIDRLIEPSPKGNGIDYLPFDPTAPATMLVGGYEHRFSERVTLTPNLVFTRYDRNDQGVRPESDLYLRLTLFLDFE